MRGGVELWPEQASQHAEKVDLLIGSFGLMVWLLTMPVFVLLTIFAIRYRRGRQVNREHAPSRGLWIELGWSIIPFLLTVGFYLWATKLFIDLYRPPADALPIHIVAKQWMWKAQHAGGAREIDAVHVPVDTPVRLVMTSEDVIHSFYVPVLRVKQDVLPGRYTTLWFQAEKTGAFPIRCAEYCGADHSGMTGQLIVMKKQDYAAFLATARDGGTRATMAEAGRQLYRRLQCGGCHEAGSAVAAPALTGLAGRSVTLADGRTVVADEQYLRDALMLPNGQVVAGYRPIMPTYEKLVSPEQANQLIAYLQSGGPR